MPGSQNFLSTHGLWPWVVPNDHSHRSCPVVKVSWPIAMEAMTNGHEQMAISNVDSPEYSYNARIRRGYLDDWITRLFPDVQIHELRQCPARNHCQIPGYKFRDECPDTLDHLGVLEKRARHHWKVREERKRKVEGKKYKQKDFPDRKEGHGHKPWRCAACWRKRSSKQRLA